MQDEKTQLAMDMLDKRLASKAKRRKQAQEAIATQNSLKRTADMRQCYIGLGFSPMSATKKAKLA